MSGKPVSHSALGASGASRWMNCPASVALSAGLPDTTSIYAAEGTAAHGLAERCLRQHDEKAEGYLGLPLREFVSKVEKPDVWQMLNDRVVTLEMVEAVNVYVAAVLSKLAELEKAGNYGALYVERKVDLTSLMPDLPSNVRPFGTCDAVILSSDAKHLYVYDFKYGAGVAVSAEDNAQIKFYGLGALLNFEAYGLEKVTVTIVQPRAAIGGEPVRSETLDAYDLMEWGMLELAPAAMRTQDADAPAKPGEWCKFCKAKGRTCEVFEREAFAAATDAFGAIVEPGDLTAKEIGERLGKVPLLKEWIKTVEEIAENEAKAGRMPAGFKWIAGRGSREWKESELAVAHEVANSTGVDITDKIVLSVAQAEKRLGKKLFEKVSHLVEKKPGKPKLAPLSDKAPAIDYVAEATKEFSEIEQL